MIVDVHTHIWETQHQLGTAVSQSLRSATDEPWDPLIASPEAHDAAMQPVQCAIIHGFVSEYLGASIRADHVSKLVARNPKKLMGFAGIDPIASSLSEQLDQAGDLGLVGVTISPAAQNFHPTHSRAMRLYEQCERDAIPVMIHTGLCFVGPTNMEFAQPYLFDEVARSFPDLRIVLARVGHPWVEQTLVLLGKHQHVYADLSDIVARPWQLLNVVLSAHQQRVIDRFLLGSGFPFVTPETAITALYSVNTLSQGTHLPSVPREHLRGIVERDALQCLGIKPKTVMSKRLRKTDLINGPELASAAASVS